MSKSIKQSKKVTQPDLIPIEAVELDMYALKLYGWPCSDGSKLITFSHVLSEFNEYLEFGGLRGGRIQSITPKIERFLRVVSYFMQNVGFPPDCYQPFYQALSLGKCACSSGQLASVIRMSAKRLQDIRNQLGHE